MAWAIQRYQPELVVLSGGADYPTMQSEAPWFRQRYEAIDQVKRAGYHSVIYRRGPGPETQRDLAGASWWRSPEPLQTIEPTLYFAPGASPAITLHAFLPLETSLAVNANGQPVVTLTGSQLGWQDLRLPAFAPVDGPLHLSRLGRPATNRRRWHGSKAMPCRPSITLSPWRMPVRARGRRFSSIQARAARCSSPAPIRSRSCSVALP